LPPDSSKGQAFVHDPRLVQEKEVKAQVKLLFTTVNGKPIVCSRALQLTQKASTQSIKTLGVWWWMLVMMMVMMVMMMVMMVMVMVMMVVDDAMVMD
jgi:hypothetical protein